MNIRKPSDYSSLYSALDVLMGSDLAEMELYCEIGRGRMRQNGEGRGCHGRGVSPGGSTRTERASHPVICAVCGPFYLTYGNTPVRLEKALRLRGRRM